MKLDVIYNTDCIEGLKQLPDGSVNICVTSPPYWGLRDYGVGGQIGLEDTPKEYVACMVTVFHEVWRVLRDSGTLWLNLGDTYATGAGRVGPGGAGGGNQGMSWRGVRQQPNRLPLPGLKTKELIGIPWRVALALQEDDWYLRSDIIWHKPNPMPESVKDRPTRSHEYLFLFTKQPRYYFDNKAIMEPCVGFNQVPPAGSEGAFGPQQTRFRKGNAKTFRGGGVYIGNQSRDNSANAVRESHGNEPNPTGTRNKRDVWTVATSGFPEAHFATFPPKLIEPCILAGCPVGGVVLDPFMGAGTTAIVAQNLGRHYVGFELNPDYCEMAKRRIRKEAANG